MHLLRVQPALGRLVLGHCVLDDCPPGQHRDAAGNCVLDDCPPGQHRDAAGNCVLDDCLPGQHRDAAGNCVLDDCPPGQHRDAAGNCVLDDCPPGQHRDAAGNCVLDDCPPGQERDATGKCVPIVIKSSSLACEVLLVAAIAMLLGGAVVVIIGVCTALPWVWIVGAIIGTVGLILFGLWALFCAVLTPCPLMRTVHCMLFWIIAVVAPILVAVAAIFGGLPCALAAASAWGGWGTLYAWLGAIMRKVGCTPTC